MNTPSALPRLSGPAVAPVAGGPARSLVVMLHGVGADGTDLIDLATYLSPALPHTAFVAPDAPFPCDLAPYGRQWFSLQDRSPPALSIGARAAAPILNAYIDEQLALHGLGPDRLALLGFSQGCMMALHVAPRRTPAIAGVVGYSGALADTGDLAHEVAARPPVLLVHGDWDDVVSVEALPRAAAALKAAGLPVEAHVRPDLGHSIDAEGLALGRDFLSRVLSG
ncbi:alpha/beta hydrolase [Azospirillum halopraeferens]|uniref:alpha/beta hydrolase n=1 Tax=Azospirillum halopraeferens TaxID=34010 RepID=UPI00040A4AE2|nr:alpha/beta fold hydrolase [Azospirillum halopraeferens]